MKDLIFVINKVTTLFEIGIQIFLKPQNLIYRFWNKLLNKIVLKFMKNYD